MPLFGGEATEVGACIGLQSDDSFSSSRPKLAIHVVRGTPLQHLFVQFLRPEKKSSSPHPPGELSQLRVVPPTATLSGQFDIAAGIALAYVHCIRNLG